ncbi:MAG TPA: ribosome biogenesis GTP-binding protein YihA/YsxC [Polyangiaceae bacterium]|nr:ribosome biogenesis GTP-binding protein YihA/YsxC [Polyangiaceae bacterium]
MNQEIVDARFTAQAGAPEQLPPPVSVEIAFVGRSNVGKSSLLNRLMQRRNLARTSSTPGCTRRITFFEVRTRDGALFTLVDLPGYGYAARSKVERRSWSHLIEHYLANRPGLSAVALLVDVRRGLESDERDLIDLLRTESSGRPAPRLVLVATKLDKLPRSRRLAAVQAIAREAGLPCIGFSSELPDTTQAVWQALRAAISSA